MIVNTLTVSQANVLRSLLRGWHLEEIKFSGESYLCNNGGRNFTFHRNILKSLLNKGLIEVETEHSFKTIYKISDDGIQSIYSAKEQPAK